MSGDTVFKIDCNKKPKRLGNPQQNYKLSNLEDRLRRALGTKVKLIFKTKDKGELRIGFFSASELENILEKLKA